jgi:hypothetical protein
MMISVITDPRRLLVIPLAACPEVWIRADS